MMQWNSTTGEVANKPAVPKPTPVPTPAPSPSSPQTPSAKPQPKEGEEVVTRKKKGFGPKKKKILTKKDAGVTLQYAREKK
jgi:hypothetical protein